MEKEIKYDNIDLVGMELFRKNNDTFYSSKLSPIMERIFLAANKEYGVQDIENEYYMKSGAVPNRIYYVYSDRVVSNKFFDIMIFNGQLCVWFYSKNTIDLIGITPVKTIMEIYDLLLRTFRKPIENTFIEKENTIVKYVMTIRLLQFLNETYGAIDFEQCKNDLAKLYMSKYTYESVMTFIEDVLDNYNNKIYFTNKEYLDSYLLLEPFIISKFVE